MTYILKVTCNMLKISLLCLAFTDFTGLVPDVNGFVREQQ